MQKTQMHWDHVKTLLSTSRQRAHIGALAEVTELRALLVSLQTRAGRQATWQAARPLLAYAVGYVIAQFASAKLAYAMSPRIAGPSPLFIHGGVAISALMLTLPRRWWRYLLLTFPLILIDAWWLGLLSAPTNWWVIIVAYLQVVIMAVVTAGLLRRFADVPLRFATVGEVGRFLAIVAIGVVPASLFSTAARYYIWSLDFWFAWRTSYLGFVLGIMTFMPAIVLWATDAPRNLNLVRRGQQTEAMLLGLAIVIVSVLVFGTRLQDQVLAYALIYILVPVLIWAAVRFGPFGLASTLALSALIAVTSAVNNRGPFVASSAPDNVLALQLFLLCIGVPLLFLAALVQERKQADTAIRASEARYRAMFHSAAIGVAVTDLDGRRLEVNEYASQMVGYTPDELRTLALRDFTHPDDVADNEALLRRALEGEIGSYQLEKRYLHKDGHIVWGRLSASLVRDQNGQPSYFVVHLEDITPRKQLEHEREEQTAQLDRIFAGIADGLVVYDAAGQVVKTNPATDRLMGLSTAPDGTVPYPAAERRPLFAPRDSQGRPLVLEEGPLARVLRGEVSEGAVEQDVRLRTLDGREVEVVTRTAPLRDREGHLLGAVSILHDQTERKRLEREHAEQAQQLQTIFDALADPLFVYDATGRLLRANPSARQLLYAEQTDATIPLAERPSEYQVRDADGRPLPREDWPITHLLRGEVLAGAGAGDVLVRLPDGRDALLSFTGGPIYDAQGQLVAIVAIARDQTERRQLEREREEARAEAERQAEQLDRVFEQMAEGVVVYDRDGHFLRANASIRRLLAPGEAIPDDSNRPLRDWSPSFEVRTAEGQPLAPGALPVERVLCGEHLSGPDAVDLLVHTPSGRDVEVRVSGAPLRDRSGQITGAVCVYLDQTERNQLAREREAALAASEAWFRTMADTAPVFLWVTNDDGLATFVNARWLQFTGRTLEEELGTGWADVIHADDAARSLEVYRAAVRMRQPFTMEYRARHFDGEYRSVVASGIPRFRPDGTFDGYIGSVTDITEHVRLEREHAAQAEQLDRIVEQMTEPLVVQDAAGRVVRVNAAMRRLIVPDALPSGYEEVPMRERVALYAMRDAQGRLLAPEDSPNMRALRGEVLTGEQAMDVRLQTPDGREAEVRISAAPLRDREGHIVGAVGVGVDLTERNQLAREREAALAHAQARSAELEAVLGAMTDGVVVYDATAHITYTNAAFRTLFGVDTRPDYARLSLAERNALVRARTPDGHDLPEDQLPQTRVLRGEVLLTGTAGSDLWGDTVDGRTLTLQLSGGPLRDGDGTVTGAVLVFRDVTAQRHLESTTRELAAQLQATLDAMTVAVFLYGGDGQVLRLNAAAQALVDAEPDFPTIAGTGWWDRVKRYHPHLPDGHPLSREEWPLARVLRGETLTAVEAQDVVLTDAQGSDQVLNYAGGPARDAAGNLMGYVFVVRDVTERRRLQHEWEEARANELALREVNQRLDTFVAMAAHDLRSPVGVSRMVVQRVQQQLLQATAGADGHASRGKPAQALIRASQGVDTIAHNLNRLMRLVQQLLDVSRVKEGTLVLQRQPVDLAELVRTCVDEQRLLNPSRVIAVELPDPATGGTAPIVVDADPDRLSQVLTNYLTNAVRYSPDDASIEVGLRIVTSTPADVGDPIVRVTVRDHGPGIPLEEQATIWERFQRARTVREAAGGLGLGLYIARTITELHGGHVGVESTPGEGATFWFTLPLAPASPAAI